MPIARGVDWGAPGPLAAGAPVVTSDRGLMDAVAADLMAGMHPEVGLTGGDMHRTLGSPRHDAADLYDGQGTRLTLDVAVAELRLADGSTSPEWFCAHMVALERGRTLFAGRTVVVMNSAFRGSANLGPRAHPNDGLLDVTDGRLGLGDRRQARRRMATGTHIPHPALGTARVASLEISFDRPATFLLDGRDVGRAKQASLRCVPDALTVVV